MAAGNLWRTDCSIAVGVALGGVQPVHLYVRRMSIIAMFECQKRRFSTKVCQEDLINEQHSLFPLRILAERRTDTFSETADEAFLTCKNDRGVRCRPVSGSCRSPLGVRFRSPVPGRAVQAVASFAGCMLGMSHSSTKLCMAKRFRLYRRKINRLRSALGVPVRLQGVVPVSVRSQAGLARLAPWGFARQSWLR